MTPTQIQHPALFVRDRNCSRGTTIQPFPDHYNNSGATNVETRFAGTYVGSELNPDLYFQNGEYPLPRPLAAAHSPSNTFLRIHNQYLPQVAQSNDGRHSHGYQRRVAPPDVYNNEINSTFHVRPSADMIRLVDHSYPPDQRRIPTTRTNDISPKMPHYQRLVAPPDVYNNEINNTFHGRLPSAADMIRLVDHYPDQQQRRIPTTRTNY